MMYGVTFLLPPRFTWKNNNGIKKKNIKTFKSLTYLSIRDLSENLKMVSGNEYIMHFSFQPKAKITYLPHLRTYHQIIYE